MKEINFHHPEVRPTTDESSTLAHPVLEELYHSRHGAWTESLHIFIQYGLMPFIDKKPDSVSVFEMGFGSGLNAAMTREAANASGVLVKYVAIELYPVDPDVVAQMSMPDQSEEERERWLELHQSAWNQKEEIDPFFTIQKIQGTFPDDTIPDAGHYDLVFYDAFAPGAQPELWGSAALRICYELLNTGGVWISYCSKGSVKRNLKEVGFQVETLPGPPGKREITRARKLKAERVKLKEPS